MLKKWYISTLVVVIALFGIFSQQQIATPNQEIVLQFTNTEVSPAEIQNTLAIVKSQLQSLGVYNIHVKEGKNAKLKITYYSDTDVASIKEIFSKQDKIAVDYNTHHQKPKEFPIDDDTMAYNLDIYEIQDANDIDWNLNGINVYKIDTKSHLFFEPNSYSYIGIIEFTKDDTLIKQAYKAYKNIVFTINNTSKSIPEVRAGPFCS